MPKLTLQELESHLWESANILRGKIDSSDYKHYIFGLLFFKRLCDVWEEEYADRMETYGDEDMARDAEEHRFHIPEGHFWSDVRKHAVNIGEHLNGAFHAIERYCQMLCMRNHTLRQNLYAASSFSSPSVKILPSITSGINL
ncbi:MAG: type I restriction-modification system subunit M N-terminal domain-containing protein [Spirochaetales bacterium]|nr:type I restriction-modification system subunit M N-terminal domain-containing protein [Spirochaetales bacterium]